MNFLLLTLIKTGLVALVLLTVLAYLVWMERKVLAHIQLRVGPNRAGPHGLLQPVADLFKMMFKEGVIPSHVHKPIYLLAPALAVSLALVPIAVIPFGPEVEIFGVTTQLGLTDINIGLLFVLAMGGLAVYGAALGGWSSNNKYSLLGGLRSSAQMISYELPMALALVSPLLLFNTLSLREIVETQGGYYFGFIPKWAIFHMPVPQVVSFVLFLIASLAETNRIPFDLPEAENELVAGFHTEYSSLLFGSFFVAEYGHITTACLMGTVLFLGGWHPLWPAGYGSNYFPVIVLWFFAAVCLLQGLHPARKWDRYTLPAIAAMLFGAGALFLIPSLQPVIVPLFWFLGKTLTLIFVFIWIRGTLPRFRYDQLMRFAWLFMFPVAVGNLLLTGLLIALGEK